MEKTTDSVAAHSMSTSLSASTASGKGDAAAIIPAGTMQGQAVRSQLV
jgi:hypothetical protein